MDSRIFEIQLLEAEVNYIKRTMPKGYALVTSKKRRTRSRRVSVSKTAIPTRVSRRRTAQDDIEFAKSIKSGRATPNRKRSRSVPRGDLWTEKCLKIVQKLARDERAATFLHPVDKLYPDLEGYFEMIKRPMDLSTVARRLKKNYYQSQKEFTSDVRLIWSNAKAYNDSDSEIFELAEEMSRVFERMMRNFDKPILPRRRFSKASRGANDLIVLDEEQEESKKNFMVVEKVTVEEVKRKQEKKKEVKEEIFTKNQKLDLKKKIEKLSDPELLEVWKILMKYDKSMEQKTEVEVNVSNLSYEALKELNIYVNSNERNKERKRKEAERKAREIKESVKAGPTNYQLDTIHSSLYKNHSFSEQRDFKSKVNSFNPKQSLSEKGGDELANNAGKDLSGSSSFITNSSDEE